MNKKIPSELAIGIILIVAIIIGGLIWFGNKKIENVPTPKIKLSCDELNISDEQIDTAVAEAIIGIENPWGNTNDFKLLSDRIEVKLGCTLEKNSTLSALQQKPANNNESKNDKFYSYCKPDEDPDFKLSSEDDQFYYYTGNKVVSGVVYQSNPEAPITFETKRNQSCKFKLTKNYTSSQKIIINDFNINEAWKNEPKCNSKDGDPYLEGDYSIKVKGFKISKSYIQQYDPNLILDKMHMSQFSFYVDYDKIESTNIKSRIGCPIVVY